MRQRFRFPLLVVMFSLANFLPSIRSTSGDEQALSGVVQRMGPGLPHRRKSRTSPAERHRGEGAKAKPLLALAASSVALSSPLSVLTSSSTVKKTESSFVPIIGILTEPTACPPTKAAAGGDGADKSKNCSYIAASYVKWLESAGARPVPILYDWPADVVVKVLGNLNGVVFPGGGNDVDRRTVRNSVGFARLGNRAQPPYIVAIVICPEHCI